MVRSFVWYCFRSLLFLIALAAPIEPSSDAWPFAAAHRALAQSSAPDESATDESDADGGATDGSAVDDSAADDSANGQADPADGDFFDPVDPTAGSPDYTEVDDIHHAIASGIKGAGVWLDSFFSTQHEEIENNKSRVRVSVGGSVEEGSDAKFHLKFKAKLALPQINKHLSLVIGGDGDSDSDISDNSNDNARDRYAGTDDRNAAVGLQYNFFQTKKKTFGAVIGVRFHKIEPVGVFGVRYRENWELGEVWDLRFTQEGLWLTDNGFSTPTRIDLDRPIAKNWMSRTTLKGDWYESEDGYYYEANQWINQRLDNKRGISYQWNNQFQTSPDNRLEESTLRIRYRQRVWREWLILDIGPQLSFPRDRDFDITPGIFGRLEVRFGG